MRFVVLMLRVIYLFMCEILSYTSCFVFDAVRLQE
jgi:hypothetical protein